MSVLFLSRTGQGFGDALQDALLSLAVLYGKWSDPQTSVQGMLSVTQWTCANSLTSLSIVALGYFKPNLMENTRNVTIATAVNFVTTLILQKLFVEGVVKLVGLMVNGLEIVIRKVKGFRKGAGVLESHV